MNMKQKKAGWSFWLLWIAASAFGMFLGVVAAFILASPIPGRWATGAVAAMILGAGVGAMQWLCLRRHASGAGWWIPATAIGGLGLLEAIDGAYHLSQSGGLSGALAGIGSLLIMAAGGGVMGTLQWLVLRKTVARAGGWIPATAASWGLVALIAHTIPLGDGDVAAIRALVMGMALVAGITGGTMVWLLRHSTHEVQPEGQPEPANRQNMEG